MSILDDETLAMIEFYAERISAAERKGREWERELVRARVAAGLPARFVAYGKSPSDAMAYVYNSGMPASLVREYRQVIESRK